MKEERDHRWESIENEGNYKMKKYICENCGVVYELIYGRCEYCGNVIDGE